MVEPNPFQKNLCQNWNHLQSWSYLNKKISFKPTTWVGFKPFKPPGHPFLGPSDRGSKRAQMPGPGKGRVSSWWPQRLKATGKKNNCGEKTKVAEIYIYTVHIKTMNENDFFEECICTFSSENEKYLNVYSSPKHERKTQKKQGTPLLGVIILFKKNMVIELCIIWSFIFSNGKIPQVKTHTHIHTKKNGEDHDDHPTENETVDGWFPTRPSTRNGRCASAEKSLLKGAKGWKAGASAERPWSFQRFSSRWLDGWRMVVGWVVPVQIGSQRSKEMGGNFPNFERFSLDTW